jgi:hypothetical protein
MIGSDQIDNDGVDVDGGRTAIFPQTRIGVDAALASTSKSGTLNVAETAGEFGRLNRMIALFTDFGLHGPYTGQMRAVLLEMAPGVPICEILPSEAALLDDVVGDRAIHPLADLPANREGARGVRDRLVRIET